MNDTPDERTLEEWADLPKDVAGEIVEDRLVEEETSDYAHEVIVAFLARILGLWADQVGAIVGRRSMSSASESRRGRGLNGFQYRPAVMAVPNEAQRTTEEPRLAHAHTWHERIDVALGGLCSVVSLSLRDIDRAFVHASLALRYRVTQ